MLQELLSCTNDSFFQSKIHSSMTMLLKCHHKSPPHHTRALHWVPIPIPMPMGFGWAWLRYYCSWVGMGVHVCDIIGNVT